MLGLRKKGHAPDYVILFTLGFLVLFGLFMLTSASSQQGLLQYDDSYFFLKKQIMTGVLFGLIGFAAGFYVPYQFYKRKWVSVVFLVLSILLLLAVFTPLGLSAKGATRWLQIGGFSFQPSEFLKISLIMYLAIWLSSGKRRQESFRDGYLPFLLIVGFVALLLVLQRSTSPVVILLSVSLIMYFMSGARLRYIGMTIGGAAVLLAILIAVTPYRLQRVMTFLHPEDDPQGSGWHIIQSKTAIGSGGFWGVGYGQSIMKQRVPEPIGDSIFAIVAEEFGFLGSSILISAFVVLVLRIFLLARGMRDQFGQLLLIGFGSVIGIQAFINVGAMSGVLPLTGTPLPFISYGGTALAIFMTMGGIVSNVSKYS
ncbi:MAG: putative peptidoglycan glycosyltransferase FtsW [Candidatus Paceibacterota bacterium]